MTNSKDFIVYNMPGMLSRDVTKRDPFDSTKWIRDEDWYESIRQKMSTLFSFYKSRGLLRHPDSLPAIDKVILKFSDLSELGQRFVKSGAADRWLASFDRPGSKRKATDMSYLEKQLARLS